MLLQKTESYAARNPFPHRGTETERKPFTTKGTKEHDGKPRRLSLKFAALCVGGLREFRTASSLPCKIKNELFADIRFFLSNDRAVWIFRGAIGCGGHTNPNLTAAADSPFPLGPFHAAE